MLSRFGKILILKLSTNDLISAVLHCFAYPMQILFLYFRGQNMTQCLLCEGDLTRLVFLKGPLWLPCREPTGGTQYQSSEQFRTKTVQKLLQ